MIGVFHHLTGKYGGRKYLDVTYLYNPESVGFISSFPSDWSTSDWHINRIHQYPERLSYIEKLKEDHIEMHKKIKLGFN